MKELSIAEKAKAYDNVRKKIATRFGSNVVKEIFSEYEESEDERIKENIIATIHLYYGEPLEDEAKEMVAWLEEQGEKEKFIKKELGCIRDYREEAIRRLHELEKQGSQILANPAKTCKIEPSTWSEEDEDNFKHLMDEIVCLGNSRNSANRLHYDRLIKFLDELKNRVQPREEWCDKDERMLDRLIAYFEKRVAFTDDDNPRYANWLKSLRPRTQWEPSEEDEELKNASISYLCNLRDSFESRKWDKEFIQKCVNWLRQMK